MSTSSARPNFVLMMCDQLRADAIGADGNSLIETPNIDFLAARGTRFCHAYSACPSCIPARAALWSGLNQWHAGLLGMGKGQGPMPNDYPHTLAGELSRAGYRTHLVGKGHFHPQRALMGFESAEIDESGRRETPWFESDYRAWFRRNAPADVTPDDHGVDFNSWLARPWHTEEHLHPSAWTMLRSIQFLEQRDRSRPFFLNISFARPHSPYVPPRDYFDLYYRGETPPAVIGDWADCHDVASDAANPNAWRGRMTAQQIHKARSGYYGDVSFIDSQIGRLFNWMRRNAGSDLDNTWFLFLSDHGDMLGDHNLWRKTYAYEGSARIPLLIMPPPSFGRLRNVADEPVELRDILPTILKAAGLEVPPAIDGRSLIPAMEAPCPDWRDYIHGEHCDCYSPEQEMQYVTDGREKFIWFPRTGNQQFFDLRKDPGETRDLSRVPASAHRVKLWRERLVAELQARDCGWCTDGTLSCSEGPLISPYKTKRWSGG
jgi:arylsulfatase